MATTENESADVATKCLHVLSDVDGYKYKLVMQGEVADIAVRRIKKYLHKATGIAPSQQLLSFNGVALQDSITGAEAGLFDGAILRLQQVAPGAQRSPETPPVLRVTSPLTSPSGTRQQQDQQQLHSSLRRHVDPSSPVHAWRTVTAPKNYSLVGSSSFPSTDGTEAPALPAALNHQQHHNLTASRTISHNKGSEDSSASSRCAPEPLQQAAARLSEGRSAPAAASPSSSSFTVNLGPVKEMGQSVYGDAQTYCRDLEARVGALSIENVRLREQLQLAARQAADPHVDWKQQEEVTHLKAALAAAKKSVAEAEQLAAQRWRVKEEEMVRELDLLREERRRQLDDTTTQETKLQELLHTMEGELRGLRYELHDKDDALQAVRLTLAQLQRQQQAAEEEEERTRQEQRRSPAITAQPLQESIDVLTEAALSHLSYFLGTPAPLQLDTDTDTCVVPVTDSLNLLVTLDRETEHLYLYVALLDELPTSPVQKLKLYEMLLQGALLGKDMAGAGVGVSVESNLVLMSISADLRHNAALALAVAAAPFVESAKAWESRIAQLLNL